MRRPSTWPGGQCKPGAIDHFLVEILHCVKCAGELAASEGGLTCRGCGVRYPVRAGVPLMFTDAEQPEDLHYPESRALMAPTSRLRRAIRAARIESSARLVLHAYLALDEWIGPRNPASPSFWMRRVIEALPRRFRMILDLGGGDGSYRRFLAGPGDEYLVLEADYDSYQVRKGLGQHRYVIGDAHNDVFRRASFDVIALFEVLEHVRNPFRIFENCARWLRPGGVLVLSTPQYWHVHGWPNDYFRYTPFGLRELARVAGLEVVDLWAMGGPCVLIWCAIELNFRVLLRLPGIRQLVAFPLLVAARILDRVFFSNNLSRANPDSRGWMMVARRPSEPTA